MARELTQAWLDKANKAYPMKINKDGDLVTCPLFLDYVVDLFKPRENKKDDGTVKLQYGVQALFQPKTDFSVPREIAKKLYASKSVVQVTETDDDGKNITSWASHKPLLGAFYKQEDRGIDAETGKLRKGYVRGALGIHPSTQLKPMVWKVVGGKKVQVTELVYDEIYSGVCAFAVMNPFYYTKGKTWKGGVGFGLKHIVILNSNTPKWFEGGAKKASIEDLKDIEIDQDSIINFESEDGGFEEPEEEGFGEEVNEFADA
jgi:hypothetical protein